MVGRTLRNYVLVCRCSFCNLQVEFCAFSLFHSTISGFFCRALSPDLSEELPFFCKVNVGSFPVLLSAVLGRPKENHGGNTALKFTKFLKDVEGSSGVFVWYWFCGLPIYCGIPANKMKTGSVNFWPSRTTKFVAMATSLDQILSRIKFLIGDINATIRVAIRPPVVE